MVGRITLFNINKEEKIKILLCGVIIFCIIGSYTISKELQQIIFVSLVGIDLIPYAKLCSLFFLSIVVVFDGYVVDRLQKHQILFCYTVILSVLGIGFSGEHE